MLFWLCDIRLNEAERSEGDSALRSGNHGRHAGVRQHSRTFTNLIDCLEGGESVEDFLEANRTVKREQAIAVTEAGKLKMLETV